MKFKFAEGVTYPLTDQIHEIPIRDFEVLYATPTGLYARKKESMNTAMSFVNGMLFGAGFLTMVVIFKVVLHAPIC